MADGAGSATLVPDGPVAVASVGAWEVHYRAGAEGLPEVGRVVFQLPAYWQWTPPQSVAPDRPGFVWATRSTGRKPGAVEANGALMYVSVEPGGGGLAPGEELVLHYGSESPEHPSPVRADPFSEDAQVFRVAVDGNGDGLFADVADPPTLRLVAREAIQLLVTASPTLCAPGDSVRVTIAPLDGADNLDEQFDAPIALAWQPLGDVGDTNWVAQLAPHDRGTALWRGVAPVKAGRYRFLASTAGLAVAQSDPITVRDHLGRRKLLFADLHGHSALSDGTGSADDYHFYASRVAGLDAGCLTDHDHHGNYPLSPEAWREQQEVAAAYDHPGDYVTLLGYEYTNWLSGHRNVYFRDAGGPVYAWSDSLYDTPEKLWGALDPERALTIPHHTAGEPVPIDWEFHNPRFEPVVEITSVHGSSERIGAPNAVRGATAGHTVVDALARGYRLGFIGSGDGHVGHPGRRLKPYPWGLAGLWVDEHTRAGVWDAIRRRSVFATTGPRIVVRFAIEATPMGGEVEFIPEKDGLMPLVALAEVLGTDTLTTVEVVKNGEPFLVLGPGEDPMTRQFTWGDSGRRGDYYYLRITQVDRAMAWSSPIWIGKAPEDSS